MSALPPAAPPRTWMLALLLGLLACSWGGAPLAQAEDAGVAGVAIEGTGLRIRAPAQPGTWTRRVESPSAGHWVVSWTEAKTAAVVVAMAFPLADQPKGDLAPLLRRAVDTQFRALGISGYGLPGGHALQLMGLRAVDARIEATYHGAPARGRCRLVLASASHVGFAWGLAPDAHAEHVATIQACVESLRPTEQALYTPRFLDPATLNDVLLRPKDEPAITRRQMLAILRVAAMAIGGALPLAHRERLQEALLRACREPSEVSLRKGVRLAPSLLEPTPGLSAAAQEARLVEAGHALYRDHLERHLGGEVVARAVIQAWDGTKETLAGRGGKRLQRRQADAVMEMGAFLASIVADAPRGVSQDEYRRLTTWLQGGWPTWSSEARASLRERPAAWMRLRHAWDSAKPPARDSFRRALLEMVHGTPASKTLQDTRDAASLKAWMRQHPPPGVERVVQQTAAWSTDQIRRLLDTLHPTTGPIPLGW